MINLRKYLVTAIVFIYANALNAQDLKTMSYQSYLANSIQMWKVSVENATSNYQTQASDESRFERALTTYGLLNATMKDQNEDVFDEYSDILEDDLDYFLDQEYRVGDSKALMSALYGLKIAYSPWKGMYYGPKSSALLEDAEEIAPGSAIVQKMIANNLNFTPETWGGDKQKALEAYRKSNQEFSKNGTERNWMYLDNLAWMGIIYKQLQKTDKARETWEMALSLEPDFQWVSKSLLPSIQ